MGGGCHGGSVVVVVSGGTVVVGDVVVVVVDVVLLVVVGATLGVVSVGTRRTSAAVVPVHELAAIPSNTDTATTRQRRPLAGGRARGTRSAYGRRLRSRA